MKIASIKIFVVAGIVYGMASMFASCDEDNTSTIGSALAGNTVEIVKDTFTVTGSTHRVPVIRPKTTQQLIGNITVKGYGSLRSDVVSQFLPSIQLDTANFSAENIDSLVLTLTYGQGDFRGDSVAPMGLTVYPLTKLLPDTISSGFDPDGYYGTSPIGNKIYNTSTFLDDETAQSASSHTITVKLPVELGRKLFNSFVSNPTSFADGYAFAKDVFPGIFLRTSFGSGRITTISSTGLSFYLSKITEIKVTEDSVKSDTTNAIHQYMLVTPEVISNNNISYTMDSELQAKFKDGINMVVAPAGTEMELELPVKSILDTYRQNADETTVLNTLSLSIPVDSIASDGVVTPPPYMLLVLKKDRDKFFADNKLTDNKTSFYAQYSSASGEYVFSGMRDYMLEMLKKDELTAEDYTFSFVPVQVNFEALANSGYYYGTQYVETDIQPYLLAPVAALVDLSKAEIVMTYSRQIFN